MAAITTPIRIGDHVAEDSAARPPEREGDWKEHEAQQKKPAVTKRIAWELDDFDPLAPMPPVAEVIEGIFPSVGLCGLAGQSQAGKTVIALDLAMSLVTGRKWLGKYKVPKKCGVVYIPYESRENVRRRWRALYIDHEIMGKVPFQLIKRPEVLTDIKAWEGFIETTAMIDAKFMSEHGVPLKVVFIDTLAASGMVARENEADSWSVVLDNLNRISEEMNIVIVLVHHATKSQESESIWRGSSSSYAAMEAILGVKIERRDGEVTRRYIFIEKSKDGESGYVADLDFGAIKVGVKESGADMFAPVLRADFDGERKEAARKAKEAQDRAEAKAKAKAAVVTDGEESFMRAVVKAMGNEGLTVGDTAEGGWRYSASQHTTEQEARKLIPSKNFKRDFDAAIGKLLKKGWLELDDQRMRYVLTSPHAVVLIRNLPSS
ncbi:AAA family ATPase [Rhizobium sp. BR 315]|uniref:AAA family ATPase n=1 Tax=Rhizobium sp. BR 315 TaxID=3040014 RepID=UPI003D33F8A0